MVSASLEVAHRGIRQPAVNGAPIKGKYYACVRGLLANIDRRKDPVLVLQTD
jgi:hypothetical protein